MRLWLIDWESAYRNDPLTDLAIMLDNLAASPELERALLQTWLRRTPDEEMFARLELVRSFTRLYYAGVLLSASAVVPRAAPDGDASAQSLAEFKAALRDRRLAPGAIETKHVLGKMYLASFLTGVAPPGLAAATVG